MTGQSVPEVQTGKVSMVQSSSRPRAPEALSEQLMPEARPADTLDEMNPAPVAPVLLLIRLFSWSSTATSSAVFGPELVISSV